MNKITTLLILVIISLPLISAFDSELTQVCSGDSELIIHCIGDLELNSLGYEVSGGITPSGGTPEIIKEQKLFGGYIFYWLFVFLLLITVCLILIIAKRRKKEE